MARITLGHMAFPGDVVETPRARGDFENTVCLPLDVPCVGFAAPRALRPRRSLGDHPSPNSGRELGTRVTKNPARGRETASRFTMFPKSGARVAQSSVSHRGIPRGAAIFRRVARGILRGALGNINGYRFDDV